MTGVLDATNVLDGVLDTTTVLVAVLDATIVLDVVLVAATGAGVSPCEPLIEASTSTSSSDVSWGMSVLVGFWVTRADISLARRTANVAWSCGLEEGGATASWTDSPTRFHG
jgi:hypothetical protein